MATEVDIIASTADNSIYQHGLWADVRAAEDGEALRGGTAMVVQGTPVGGGVIYVERGFLYFATGAVIPAGATIISAVLNLKTSASNNNRNNDYTLYIVAGTPADETDIALADYDQVGATSFGFTEYPAVNTAFEIEVNATGIADIAKGSGNTVWSLRIGSDFKDQEPAVADGVGILSADYATEADRPTLTVVYTTATTNTKTTTATARVKQLGVSRTTQVKARTKKELLWLLQARANIASASARVSQVSLSSPTSGSSQASPVVFTWHLPQTSYGEPVHSQIQVDNTDDTFGDLAIDKASWSDEGFEYWNNAEWAAYPTSGVSSGYAGNEARVSAAVTSGMKYWRVRGRIG